MSQLITVNNPMSGGEVVDKGFIRVVFQKGFPREVGVNGCRVEDVVKLAVDRLYEYQSGPLACEENGDALVHLKGALRALDERIKRRREQGVLNTMGRHETHRTEDIDEDFSATGA